MSKDRNIKMETDNTTNDKGRDRWRAAVEECHDQTQPRIILARVAQCERRLGFAIGLDGKTQQTMKWTTMLVDGVTETVRVNSGGDSRVFKERKKNLGKMMNSTLSRILRLI